MKRNVISLLLVCAMLLGVTAQAFGAGIQYLPGVTKEMSDPAFWAEDETVLMTPEEIKELNALTISTKGTNMYDLKNQPETTDGKALNERLLSSTKADANYYLGWTYLGEEEKATEEDFDVMVRNTQNSSPSTSQKTKYAVAVKRTALRAFPSMTPIWDDPTDPEFDYQYLVGVRVNEPLVITSISADEKFYLAKGTCCSGWVPVEDVAICEDKEEWLSAWDLPEEKSLVVYGDRVYTETSYTGKETSDFMLTMGTVLELADVDDPDLMVDNRAVYQNYVVWMPVRDEDGNYAKKLTLISEHEDVSVGYLPLTQKNIAEVAMAALGNAYGWGGSLNSDDCSGYVRNVYKCFGLELARNTTWQAAMPMTKVTMTGMCREERVKFMDALPIGSILYFSGHEMMYLGKVDGEYYVLSSVSKIRDPQGGTEVDRIRSILISTLDTKRASGVNWLDSLTAANVPYWGLLEGKTYPMPKESWYNEGVAYCLNKGLMKAGADGMFRPNENATRAEIVKILWNLEGKPVTDAAISFADVAPDADYAEAVRWAAAEGLVSGLTADTFSPESMMTREQLATVLYNYVKDKGFGFTGMWMFQLKFADAKSISGYAYEPLCWMTMKGILSGVGNDKLDPKGTVTRAQLAVITQKFNGLLSELEAEKAAQEALEQEIAEDLAEEAAE